MTLPRLRTKQVWPSPICKNFTDDPPLRSPGPPLPIKNVPSLIYFCFENNDNGITTLQNLKAVSSSFHSFYFRRRKILNYFSRSARHARREGRPSRRACLALRARLARVLARLKNAKNNACSAGYFYFNGSKPALLIS